MKTAKPNAPRTLLAALFAGALYALGLAGCNTIAGIGEDVEAAGGAVEEEAEEKKGY